MKIHDKDIKKYRFKYHRNCNVIKFLTAIKLITFLQIIYPGIKGNHSEMKQFYLKIVLPTRYSSTL